MTALNRQEFERILLIKPSSLGDVIHALPVLDGLRGRFPNARIDWLVAPAFAPLLAGHPALSEVIPFDRAHFGRIGRSLSVLRDFMNFLKELRSRRYDLAIDLQGLFRSAFISKACGAPARLGFSTAREGARWFYTHHIVTPLPDEHAVDKNLRVMAILNAAVDRVEFNLMIKESDRQIARELLGRTAGQNTGPYIAVIPGARWETKLWPESAFAETIDRLVGGGAACVLLGASSERERCERIAAACEKQPLNLAGRTDIRGMCAVIEASDVVLCHDSAPMHVAVALNRPLVCLMGPTHPQRTGPYRRPQDVFRLDLECSPCFLRRLKQCPYDHRCMKDLPVAKVVAGVQNRLNNWKSL